MAPVAGTLVAAQRTVVDETTLSATERVVGAADHAAGRLGARG